MEIFYDSLRGQGFVNTTPPTPDEWDHPDGLQVRIQHVAGVCIVRYRRTPDCGFDSPGIDAQMEHDRQHPWNTLTRAHGDEQTRFNDWLVTTSGVIATRLAALKAVA